MPTVLSRCHGGIIRDATCVLIARAHGRASWKSRSDIGAIEPGRWHVWHFVWKIGATSFVNVGACWAKAGVEATNKDANASSPVRTLISFLSLRVTSPLP